MGKLILLAVCAWSFSAAASYHSCIPINTRHPDLPVVPALALKLTPADSGQWTASLFNETSRRALGTYKVRRLTDSETYTIFASTEFTLSMYKTRSYGHRKADLQIPALKINSEDWLCKWVP